MTHTSGSVRAAAAAGMGQRPVMLHVFQFAAFPAPGAEPGRDYTWRSGLVVAGAAAILIIPMAALAAATVLVMLQLTLIIICHLPAAIRASLPAGQIAEGHANALSLIQLYATPGRRAADDPRHRPPVAARLSSQDGSDLRVRGGRLRPEANPILRSSARNCAPFCAFSPLHKGEPIMKYILTFVFASLTILVASCNTIAGVGEDTQRAGEAIEDAADDNS